MKKFLVLVVLCVAALCGLQAQRCTFSGTFSDFPEGFQTVLLKVNNNKMELVDTLKLDKKGHFKITLTHKEPTLYVIPMPDRESGVCHLMLEPDGKVTVDIQYLPAMKMFRITNCKGSENVALYKSFNDILLNASTPEEQVKVPALVEQLLRENKNTLMSAFLVTFFEQNFDSYASLYSDVRDALVTKYPNDSFVNHLNERLRGLLLPGMMAPEIEMSDPDGVTRRLSDLRGQVVLIDFWASWCGPCRRENPNVVRVYKKFHDKGFEIFSVSLDNTRSAWTAAIKKDGLVWPNHVSDLTGWTSSGGKTYGITSVPATVLVDREGKIVARNLRGGDLERALDQLFQGETEK